MVNIFFLHLGYSNEAKATMLETALFYRDRPALAKAISVPKTVKDQHGKVTSGPTDAEKFNGYNLRKQHVKLSQEVPFCTNLHIDFLQTAK